MTARKEPGYGNGNSGYTSPPMPDPTILTTQALIREIAGIKELFGVHLDGVAKQMASLEKTVHEWGREIDLRVGHLHELHDEKFGSIQTQFVERDKRDERTSRDGKEAVAAALQAAKEAVGEQNRSSALSISKSEISTLKQIDQLNNLIGSYSKASDDKITDIKERLDRHEGNTSGAKDTWGYFIGAAGLVIAGVAILVSILVHHG